LLVSIIKFITKNEIIKIHDDIILEFGGEKGILIDGNLEFIIEFIRVQFYKIKFDNLFKISAFILWYIIIGHPFVDGNKRTGMEAADLFLRKNGYYLDFNTNSGVSFTLTIARNERNIISIYNWIIKHLKKL
jgi:death-on-curing protein